MTLSGYGVELAIKSQEYKAKDDTKIEGDATSAEDDDFDDDDVSGFMFATLKFVTKHDFLFELKKCAIVFLYLCVLYFRKKYPELKDNLTEYRQHLLDSTNEVPELKQWQLQGSFERLTERVNMCFGSTLSAIVFLQILVSKQRSSS